MDSHAASPSLDRLAAAYRYLTYSDRIEGWMYQTTALAMMELIWLQEEAGLAGNIAEIGVHHGCSALALVAAARPDETMIAIDLFDRQDLNLDDSGRGSLAAFQGHLQYFSARAGPHCREILRRDPRRREGARPCRSQVLLARRRAHARAHA